MKLRHRVIHVRSARTFRIATGATDEFPFVITDVTDGEHVGLGEGAASRRVTGEDTTSVGHFLDWAAKELETLDADAWETFLDHVHDDICGNPTARCALDLALHDLAGKREGVPARRFYDIGDARLETCMTVSLDTPERMADEAREYRARGFRALKLKLGDAPRDVARARAVRDAVPDARIRADANTGWTPAQAPGVLAGLHDVGVEFIEQPYRPDMDAQFAELSRDSPVPLYADESVKDILDVERLHKLGFRGGMNLKLMKTGGIRPAVRAARRAKELGHLVQLGCNIETAIGISGGVQLLPLLDHADLDGHLLLADEPYIGPRPIDGWYETSNAPGLGVRPR